jgi:adenylate cyclase
MAHLFISYARPEETRAAQVADCLRADGFEVWRDDELPAHRAYADVIEERIKSAAAVIVLWSAEAAKSHWVRAEADTARAAQTLVQASLDGTIPPMPFSQIQCADLKSWSGKRNDAGWRKLVGSVTALAGSRGQEENARAAARDISICVLPFQNMSGDPEQEYFSDGITEDITTDLSKVSALEVIARNTAFTFKGQSVDVCDVAKKLGVTHVLEGSVRKVGNQVRITAQLIEGRGGGHLWADRYDRKLDDIFSIQDEISGAIVAALKVKLLPAEKKAIAQRRTESAEAYNLYLLARQYWMTGNHGDIRREQRVMRICSRAVEIDPHYADAWALLAMVQSSLRYTYGHDVDDGFAAAHTALAIDPTIAEAHLPMVRRLQERQQHDAAAAAMEAAIRLGPDSWEVNKEAGLFFLFQGDVATATSHYERAAKLVESDFHAWVMLSTCYRALGDMKKLREAARMMVAESQKAVQQDPSNGAALGVLAGGYAILGDEERTRDWISRALLIDPDNLNMRYNFACFLAGHLGDKEGALSMLESISRRPDAIRQLKYAETDPDLDSIHDDPRFEKIMRGVPKSPRVQKGAPASSHA